MELIIEGAKEAAAVLEKCSKEYEKQARSFLNKQGNELKKRILAQADANGVGQVTGNYRNSIVKQNPYKYYLENLGNAKDSVKAYSRRTGASRRKTGYGGKADHGKKAKFTDGYEYKGYHTHLIEYGHEMTAYKDGPSFGRTRAFNVYSDALASYAGEFERACEAFVNEITAEV